MMFIAAISRVLIWIRPRQTHKGIGHPDRTGVVFEYFEDATHEYACATTPHTGLNQITGHILLYHLTYARLQVVEACHADHGDCVQRPIKALAPDVQARLTYQRERQCVHQLPDRLEQWLAPRGRRERPV